MPSSNEHPPSSDTVIPPWFHHSQESQQNPITSISPFQVNHSTPCWVPAPVIPPYNSDQSPVSINTSLPQAPVTPFHNSDQTSPGPLQVHSTTPTAPVQIQDSSGSLLHPDSVIQKYPKLRTISNAGRLAVRLAHESYFGKDLLYTSTVYGQKDHKALPLDKVLELKRKMLSIHLGSVSSEVEFEAVWTKCVNAINHSASALRSKKPLSFSINKNSI